MNNRHGPRKPNNRQSKEASEQPQESSPQHAHNNDSASLVSEEVPFINNPRRHRPGPSANRRGGRGGGRGRGRGTGLRRGRGEVPKSDLASEDVETEEDSISQEFNNAALCNNPDQEELKICSGLEHLTVQDHQLDHEIEIDQAQVQAQLQNTASRASASQDRRRRGKHHLHTGANQEHPETVDAGTTHDKRNQARHRPKPNRTNEHGTNEQHDAQADNKDASKQVAEAANPSRRRGNHSQESNDPVETGGQQHHGKRLAPEKADRVIRRGRHPQQTLHVKLQNESNAAQDSNDGRERAGRRTKPHDSSTTRVLENVSDPTQSHQLESPAPQAGVELNDMQLKPLVRTGERHRREPRHTKKLSASDKPETEPNRHAPRQKRDRNLTQRKETENGQVVILRNRSETRSQITHIHGADLHDESTLVEKIALAASGELLDDHYQGKRPPKSSSRLLSTAAQLEDAKQDSAIHKLEELPTESTDTISKSQKSSPVPSPARMTFKLSEETALLAFGKQKKKEKKTKKAKPDLEASITVEQDKNIHEPESEEEVLEENTSANYTETTVSQAIAALPAKEVTITASTSIRTSSITPNISRSSSATGLVSVAEGVQAEPLAPPTKSSNKPRSAKKKSKATKKESSNGAKLFNRAVRACVEDSDPDSMRAILRDPQNKHYALDAMVLETVMKAYVMAAMFEDALYCLRHNTLPGTLSAGQTLQILTCMPQNLRNSSAFTAADMINALAIATDFESPKKRTYFMRIVRGISLEFLEEATSARDRICSAPCERLVRSLLCVVEAQLKRGRKNAELVVMPGDQLGIYIPESNFMDNRGIQSGDAVSILPYAGPYPMSAESLDRNMIEATVVSTTPIMVLKLQDKTNATLINMLTEPSPGNVYRIDKLANRMGFNRQLTAAVAIASPDESKGVKDSRRPCPELVQAITAMDENIDKVLQGAVNGNYNISSSDPYNKNSTAAICCEAVPLWMDEEREVETEETSRDQGRILLEKHNVLEGLNASQRLAIEGASSNRLTLVQGPPGTGKTAVAIRILKYWATLASYENNGGNPILATSDSNIAVDNLVEGCAKAGLNVVRLGRPEAIRPELLKYCIDRPGSSNSSSNLKDMQGSQDGGYLGTPSQSSGTYHKERMKKLRAAQVVCCTCIGSGGDILDTLTFERVLVDEATQATEPAVLVPLTRGCRQLVLVGDHCQLPPTVLSTHAEEEGLGVPLFSRMVACGVPPFMLDTQYRMHPGIAMFPSDLFYGGKLNNGVSPPERRPLPGFPWPREEFPVAFVPVSHGVEMDDGVSKYNEAEAAAACDAVTALLQGGQCTVSDVAVVTPYAAQVRLIRRMLRKLVQRPPYVEVSSVDGFQGREKEAVIFSAVRSNDYGAVGFVSDWRRINVSFTRARRALIVIGNDQTLRRGDPDTWLPWLAWADAHGVNMDKPGIPRGRYDADQMRRVRGGTTAAEMLKHVLERQQAQLKVAERQLQKAERNAAGHIVAHSDEEPEEEFDEELNTKNLEKDLAKLANTDGCWDDSESDDGTDDIANNESIVPTSSRASIVSSSHYKSASDDEPQDAWDI